MPKTVKVRVYEYDELNEEAKEKARQWWAECSLSDPWDEYLEDDAKNIGLVSTRKGLEFNIGPKDTALLIFANHGKTCETYKDAMAFWAERKRVKHKDRGSIEAVEIEFLDNLTHDYNRLAEEQVEYETYGEGAIESIRANGYTFTKDGKRFG